MKLTIAWTIQVISSQHLLSIITDIYVVCEDQQQLKRTVLA